MAVHGIFSLSMKLWRSIHDALNGGSSCLTETDGGDHLTGPQLLRLVGNPASETEIAIAMERRASAVQVPLSFFLQCPASAAAACR
jgi:hypothetical protein